MPPRSAAYYSLTELRSRLETWLRGTAPDTDLAGPGRAGQQTLDRLGELFGPLDTEKLPGVRGTLFAKVLHRKRPALSPLFDRHVYRVYVGHPDAPLRPDRRRS